MRTQAMHQMGSIFLTLFVGIALLPVACTGQRDEPQIETWPAGDTSYVFTQPDAHFTLDDDLDEISGLALLEDGSLAAIQDEDGILYILDPESGGIVDRRDFGKRGDYEAVEIAEGRLFILRSDGRVFWFNDWSGDALQGESFDLDIPSRCDAEGLRFDAEESRLLVICKDEPGPGLEVEKAIYAFDVNGEKLQDEPVYVIDSRQFSASISDHPVNEAVRSVLSKRVDFSGFRPSELAFHPLTGELFVLSSVRESLVSLGRDGNVTGIWVLPEKLLEQPEGMAFLPNGDLFIASEAGGGKNAVLLRFNYRGTTTRPAE